MISLVTVKSSHAQLADCANVRNVKHGTRSEWKRRAGTAFDRKIERSEVGWSRAR